MTRKGATEKLSWISGIERLLAAMGVIATLLSTYIAVKSFNSEEAESEGAIFAFQKTAADLVAPKGYSLRPTYREVAPEDEPFKLASPQSIKLTAREREVTFTLTDVWESGKVSVILDGIPRDLSSGDKFPIEGTDCMFWFLRVEEDGQFASFEVICDG